jgi:hypothetical protein
MLINTVLFASLAFAVTVVEKHVLSDASEPTRVRYNFTWPCAPLPKMPAATDVRRLRAQDIKVVMALGDSMTAGFAMRAEPAYDVWDLWRGLHEFRGSVFSVGGDAGYVTLPNFIAHYRQGQVPVGASVGITLPLDAVRWEGHIVQPHVPDLCRLNAAQSMAKIGDVPAQVTYLQQLLQTYAANGTIDFHNDWKLLTILIGANNVCGSCNNGTIHDPVYFGQTLDQILAEVTSTIPRVFVNVVTMFNISQVFTVHSSSEYCTFMWETLASHECGCMTDPQSTPQTRQAMDLHSVAFNQQIYNVVSKYNTGNNSFHVVAQPFTERMRITETDELSALECFHPSLLANAGFAAALWNNMMEPPGKKETLSVHHVSINCPNLNTFFQ